MGNCRFYLISSKKSNRDSNGIKKILLGSENRIDTYGFIWIDSWEKIIQMQFIFEEIALEWFYEKGFSFSETNRVLDNPDGIGYQKGVRVLHPTEKKNKFVFEEAKNASYPKEWSKKILEIFKTS